MTSNGFYYVGRLDEASVRSATRRGIEDSEYYTIKIEFLGENKLDGEGISLDIKGEDLFIEIKNLKNILKDKLVNPELLTNEDYNNPRGIIKNFNAVSGEFKYEQ